MSAADPPEPGEPRLTEAWRSMFPATAAGRTPDRSADRPDDRVAPDAELSPPPAPGPGADR